MAVQVAMMSVYPCSITKATFLSRLLATFLAMGESCGMEHQGCMHQIDMGFEMQ
jgi:hypothetical protein